MPKKPKPRPRLPHITKAEVTGWGVRVEVERGDKSIYQVDVIPHENDVLLNFSFTNDRILTADRVAANQIVVNMTKAKS